MKNNRYLSDQLITYIGNKRKLLQFIGFGIDTVLSQLDLNKISILDGFAGSGIVSRFLKGYSSTLHSNDFEYYSYIIGKCYLSNSYEIPSDISDIVNSINNKKLTTELGHGFIELMYSPKDDNDIKEGERVFYTNTNARIIDNIRRMIMDVEPDIQHFLIAPLLSEASIKVNTSGVFKGFYKNTSTNRGQWGGNGKNALSRIMSEISLLEPVMGPYDCEYKMYNEDINTLIQNIPMVDVAYYDPPYNQHPYGSNYFMLNAISKYEIPLNISNISGIPKDWQRSKYNKLQDAIFSMDHLMKNTKAKFIITSYNSEGIVDQPTLLSIMERYGDVTIINTEYQTFRGSRNLKDRNPKVKEFLYILKKT